MYPPTITSTILDRKLEQEFQAISKESRKVKFIPLVDQVMYYNAKFTKLVPNVVDCTLQFHPTRFKVKAPISKVYSGDLIVGIWVKEGL